MNEKEIDVILTKNDKKKIVLRFIMEDKNYDLNLESNDSESIKIVFVELAKHIRISPIKLNYAVEKEKIDEKEDGLFIDSSQEYIDQLKSELLSIENDSDLKTIRNQIESGN